MVLVTASSPFGSRSRTRILLALRLLESSYPRALARLLGTPIFAVRKALAGLERDGLVASHLVGRTRVYTLARSYVARDELAAFLRRLADLDLDLAGRVAAAGAPGAGAVPAVPPPDVAPQEPLLVGRGRRPADDGWKNW